MVGIVRIKQRQQDPRIGQNHRRPVLRFLRRPAANVFPVVVDVFLVAANVFAVFVQVILVAAKVFLILGWLASAAAAADPVWPSTRWAIVDDPAALGWSIEKLKKDEEYPRAYGATGVMIGTMYIAIGTASKIGCS